METNESPGPQVAQSQLSTRPTSQVLDASVPVSSRRQYERLSLPFAARLPLLASISGSAGLLLGLARGGQEAGLRFRAEHAHRLPTSQAGWFLYHKSKNYHAMLGGMIEGMKMAGRVSLWTCVFAGMEEGLDRGRAAVRRSWRSMFSHQSSYENDELVASNRDFASTMLAGIGTAGLFSAWNRLPIPTVVRMAKLGAKVGLGFGVAQDLISILRGRRLGYVDYIKRVTLGTDVTYA